MKIPRSLKQITVQQYQEIHPSIVKLKQLDDTLDIASEWCKIISVLTVKHINEIEDLDLIILKKHIKTLHFLVKPEPQLITKFLWIKGSLYKGVNHADQLNASQIVAIKTFLGQGNYVDQLHNLAPCSYKKFKLKHQYKAGDRLITKYFTWVYDGSDHVELSEALLKKSAHDILPVVFFCSKVLQYLMENSEAYLQSQKIIKERMEEIQQLIYDPSFSIIGVGMPQ